MTDQELIRELREQIRIRTEMLNLLEKETKTTHASTARGTTTTSATGRRTLSAAARRRIAVAQRKRWALVRGGKKAA
jgi:hypothetical protein